MFEVFDYLWNDSLQNYFVSFRRLYFLFTSAGFLYLRPIMAEQSCNTFEITINDEVYYCYVSRITDESVVFWLGRTPRSTFVSLGFQSSGGDESVKFSRVLEPINYNSTMMSNVSLKLSRLLGGKQVPFSIMHTRTLGNLLSRCNFNIKPDRIWGRVLRNVNAFWFLIRILS